jgi:hypothetical protein
MNFFILSPYLQLKNPQRAIFQKSLNWDLLLKDAGRVMLAVWVNPMANSFISASYDTSTSNARASSAFQPT